MIIFVLGVEDLADTRFALSPLHETMLSLRVLQDPGLSALHLSWRRSVLGGLGTLDTGLLMSLVARRCTLPDFLTPNPTGFAPGFEEELSAVRQVSWLGSPRARLLGLLEEPLPIVELARRFRVTPSAVSQHLRVLHATGLVTRTRDGRHVLYRRSALGDRLMATAAEPPDQ